MGFRCGIIGLPNVGKSTLFNSLARAEVDAKNYPFCTIKPNFSTVLVPDHRLYQLAEIVTPRKITPEKIEVVDIAGLVSGASEGEGLGNKFLSNIRETDAIIHVVRCFHNDEIIHIDNRVDPVKDIETVNTELLLSDIQSVEKTLNRLKKISGHLDKNVKLKVKFYKNLMGHLEAGKLARSFSFGVAEHSWIREMSLLTYKPTFYVANISKSASRCEKDFLREVFEFAKKNSDHVIAVCAPAEAEIIDLKDCRESNLSSTSEFKRLSPNEIIRMGYKILNLQTYFTVGIKEVRAWAIPIGTTAPKAAKKIHTDFERGFIRAEIINFNDYVKYGGYKGTRDAGRVHLEGKSYIIQDGDIVNFRFNV